MIIAQDAARCMGRLAGCRCIREAGHAHGHVYISYDYHEES